MYLKCLYSLVFWNAIQMLNCVKQQLRGLLVENSILKKGGVSRYIFEIISVWLFVTEIRNVLTVTSLVFGRKKVSFKYTESI